MDLNLCFCENLLKQEQLNKNSFENYFFGKWIVNYMKTFLSLDGNISHFILTQKSFLKNVSFKNAFKYFCMIEECMTSTSIRNVNNDYWVSIKAFEKINLPTEKSR